MLCISIFKVRKRLKQPLERFGTVSKEKKEIELISKGYTPAYTKRSTRQAIGKWQATRNSALTEKTFPCKYFLRTQH